MKMKCAFYILSLTIILLTSCKSKDEYDVSNAAIEAQEVVDSISDVHTLLSYAKKYANEKEKRAEIIVREAIGINYRNNSYFDKAIIQHQKAISLASSSKDTLYWIRALNQQGTNLRRVGDLNEALNFHYKALDLCDEYPDTSRVSRKNRVVSLNGLGNVLLTMGNYEAAETMFRKALAGEKELGSLVGQAINYANIGSIYEHKDKLDSARTYYNKSMHRNAEAGNAIGIGLCYQYLGKLDEREGKMSSAEKNYYKSYKVMLPTGDSWHWLEPCISLAKLYMSTEQEDSARKYVNLCLTTAEEIKSKEHIAETCKLASAFEQKWASPARALELYKRGVALTDSILSEKNYIHMQNMRVDYEIKQRKAEVMQAKEETHQEQKTRRAITIIAAILLSILGGEVAYLHYKNRIKKKTVETTTKEELETVEEVKHDSNFIKMLNEFIDKNLSDSTFNSTVLATHMCLSRAQLNRKVNAEVGTDTTHYIRDRRLEHACRMLKKNELAIMDIQIACGFDSPGYFSRVFKQKYGKSPSEYKKEG